MADDAQSAGSGAAPRVQGRDPQFVALMALAFRNVDVSPEDPVEEWPLEAVSTVLERGGLSHWQRLAQAIRMEPWGRVARAVEEALAYSRPYGVAPLMERTIASAREAAEGSEREVVAAEVTGLIEASGLSRAEFASRVGTSASRLSTYVNGKVTPSAAMLVRMRRVAEMEPDPHDVELAEVLLGLTPPERLRALGRYARLRGLARGER
jgi:transcriptional regulator with XRE-family HTH domain